MHFYPGLCLLVHILKLFRGDYRFFFSTFHATCYLRVKKIFSALYFYYKQCLNYCDLKSDLYEATQASALLNSCDSCNFILCYRMTTTCEFHIAVPTEANLYLFKISKYILNYNLSKWHSSSLIFLFNNQSFAAIIILNRLKWGLFKTNYLTVCSQFLNTCTI